MRRDRTGSGDSLDLRGSLLCHGGFHVAEFRKIVRPRGIRLGDFLSSFLFCPISKRTAFLLLTDAPRQIQNVPQFQLTHKEFRDSSKKQWERECWMSSIGRLRKRSFLPAKPQIECKSFTSRLIITSREGQRPRDRHCATSRRRAGGGSAAREYRFRKW